MPDCSYEKLDLTAAAIRLGIGVDGVRRRLQRGTLQGIKEDGKWFVLLALNSAEQSVSPNAEQPNPSAEQLLNSAEHRYTTFLEAENERLWKELEERRREVSELHILLRREQERNERALLPPPADYHDVVPQHAEQSVTKRKRWWHW